MSIKKNEILINLILWREILAIPTYTILFNYFTKLFWICLVVGRIINLIIISKDIDINKLFDTCFEKYEKGDKNFKKLAKLGIFAVVTTPILYILTLVNNQKLFMILIAVEIADFIVIKLLDEELIKIMKNDCKRLFIKIKNRKEPKK